MRLRVPLLTAVLAISLAACSGGKSSLPPLGGANGVGVFDAATSQCDVSYDGFIWYTVAAGSFAPIDVQRERCPASALKAKPDPPIPSWAKPDGPTKAIFVATSLQENYAPGGMEALEQVASAHHIPMTWMNSSGLYIATAQQIALYNSYRAANGDDLQSSPAMVPALEAAFPWFVASVSVQLGGRGHVQRDPAAALNLGMHGFWGITWNSQGTDGIRDYGSPWGAYCADIDSFKRPSPTGDCTLTGFEWTARDLTRAFFSGDEAAFSTDPDDLQQRAGFTPAAAQTYIAELADAYAAAGESRPIVMFSQQESAEANNAGDPQILDALYARAVADGMKVETLAQAASDVRAFGSQARAVAFPYIAGGTAMASAILGGVTLYPATIDYHDNVAGMTFIAGHTTPERVFRYADYPVSSDQLPLPTVPQSQLPQLGNVAVGGGQIVFHFVAPQALHYGVALWSNPAALGLSGTGVVPAGRAGVVLVFDLQSGANDVAFSCANCSSTTFRYSE
jgi:hypothetical protein